MLARPNQIYDSDDLRMLSRVLKEALNATMEFNDTSINETSIQETGSRLSQVILNHFEAGETDPEVLTTIAVNSLRRERRA
jgi:hypothetical protein